MMAIIAMAKMAAIITLFSSVILFSLLLGLFWKVTEINKFSILWQIFLVSKPD
jgi:hypothetical protein